MSHAALTNVTPTFVQRGYLHAVTNPPVQGTISVDSIPRDNWAMFTELPTGPHQVCFGPVTGFTPPPCQAVTLSPGTETQVTGNYVVNPAAPGPTNYGELRVTSSPAVPTQILVDGVPRDTWGLAWLKLAPGNYTVSFAHVEGWTEPAPQTVTVTAGQVTTVTGSFSQRGSLQVIVDRGAPGMISVDGIRRNSSGVWTDLPVGPHQVCFGPIGGFITPPCQDIVLTPGALTEVAATYNFA